MARERVVKGSPAGGEFSTRRRDEGVPLFDLPTQVLARSVSPSGLFAVVVRPGGKGFDVVHHPSGLRVPSQVLDKRVGHRVAVKGASVSDGAIRFHTDAVRYMEAIDTSEVRELLDADGIRKPSGVGAGRAATQAFSDVVLEQIEAMERGER